MIWINGKVKSTMQLHQLKSIGVGKILNLFKSL